ncbi:hypothetical protein AGOR_G00193390 [Albula goreensis]|uniref:Uncharacterized protein n=1 Tax=Albula goreensis TaxID=1534307 RepID=A0A8T3CVT3_9TELE|nr:hypothetical protein AGOR_G00193390 [Albula goreensis]
MNRKESSHSPGKEDEGSEPKPTISRDRNESDIQPRMSEVEESPELSPDGNEGEETSASDNNTHGRKSKTKSRENKRGIVTGCIAADTPGHFVSKTSGNKRAVLLHHGPVHTKRARLQHRPPHQRKTWKEADVSEFT